MLTQIADAQHQGEPAVQRRDHNCLTERDKGSRPRKTDKANTGNDREEKHSGHDFNRRDNMAVERLWIHVSIANGGESLHTEEKRFDKRTGFHPCDAILLEPIKLGEGEIEHDIN